MFPTKFRFIWSNGFRGEVFKKSANQKQESPVAAMFVNGLGRNEQSLQRTIHRCFLPSFSSFGQAVSEEIFRNRSIRNKPVVAMFVNEMSNLYKRTFLRSSYQVSVHLAMWFQRRRFFKKSTYQKQKNCLWRTCLLADRDKICNLYRGPSIDTS